MKNKNIKQLEEFLKVDEKEKKNIPHNKNILNLTNLSMVLLILLGF